jgi:hypothetical protein
VKWFARNLWDLLGVAPSRRRAAAAPAPAPAPVPAPVPAPASRRPARRAGPSMQERYDALVREMKQAHRVRVRRWRRSTSGCAWELRGADGSLTRVIEAPYPRGPVSCAIFLHEVGHHAIGFDTYRPRCLEEFHAWRWALDTMRARGLNVTPAVERRARDAVRYAVRRARRCGLRVVPQELSAYI